MDDFIPFIDERFVKKQREKARAIRASQWWKRKCAEGVCHYCREKIPPKELTMDHMIPVARGGRSERFNVVPCCKACNTRKRTLLPAEWDAYMEKLRP